MKARSPQRPPHPGRLAGGRIDRVAPLQGGPKDPPPAQGERREKVEQP